MGAVIAIALTPLLALISWLCAASLVMLIVFGPIALIVGIWLGQIQPMHVKKFLARELW